MGFTALLSRLFPKHNNYKIFQRTSAKRWTGHRWNFDQLEDRVLLSAAVWTDRPDYLPLSSAGIGGSGFGAAEAVILRLQHNNDGYMDGPYTWQATSQADGSFQTQWSVVNEINSSYI